MDRQDVQHKEFGLGKQQSVEWRVVSEERNPGDMSPRWDDVEYAETDSSTYGSYFITSIFLVKLSPPAWSLYI